MALDNVDQGNTSEPPMGNEAAEDDDEPDERENSATIQKMCSKRGGISAPRIGANFTRL